MITSLDETSIASLKAGQVIVEPSNVVKELLENAIDAGATAITVKIANYGLDAVQVTDNGHGIDQQDFELVAVHHTTSKLASFDDLSAVKTLGFRGEALATMCTVSNLEIQTCTDGEIGSTLTFNRAGSVNTCVKCPSARGTQVTVSNLFENLPVRRKDYERNFRKKYTEMIKTIQSYALIWSGTLVIEHTVNNKKSVVLRAQGIDMSDRISLLYGAKVARTLVEIDARTELAHFVGRISPPMALAKGQQRSHTRLVYVNGRPTDQDHIVKAVVQLFQEYEPYSKPFFAIDIRVAPSQLDINITPDKRDVRLLQLYRVIDQLRVVLKGLFSSDEEALVAQKSVELTQPRLAPSLTKFLGTGPMTRQNKDDSNKSDSEDEQHEGFEQPPHKTARLERPSSTSSIVLSSSLKSFSHGASSISAAEDETEDEQQESNGDASQDLMVSQILMESSAQIASENLETAELSSQNPMESEALEHESTDALDHHELDDFTTETTSLDHPFVPADQELSHESDAEPMLDVEEPQLEAQALQAEQEVESELQDMQPPTEITSLRKDHKTLNVHISLPVTLQDVKNSMQQLNTESSKSIQNYAIDEESATERLNLIIRKTDFADMEIIGQFNLGFILVRKAKPSGGQDIFIIDQHASDEIYNFERLQRTTVLRRQPLVVPTQLELSAVEELVLINNLEVFEQNGFSIKIDQDAVPGKQCSLTALPFSKGTIFNESDINELIYKIQDYHHQESSNTIKCSKLRAMFAMRACRSSIMIGHPLTTSAMTKVVKNLGTLDKPWNCPHGRPTLRHITSLG